MKSKELMGEYSVNHPKIVTGAMVTITLVLALLAALPSLWPEAFPFLNSLTVDTDPENMLPKDEPVRVFHDEMKEEMSLHDMVVVGIVNDEDDNGVFNPLSLQKIYQLTQYIKTLHWERDGERVGVIEVDLIAPSTVDNIEQAGPGVVTFEWLMRSPPETEENALAVREKAQNIPFLNGTLVSEDGKAVALYLPLTSKDISNNIYRQLREKIKTLEGPEQFYITGLPVAEDTFGVEMFKQMAISAPMAMVIIFILMLVFFKKLILIISPMIVALVSVICTMGLLIATGNTVHIMSSMIPIFIMPIAVLDSIHILSEFFDRYQETRDRRKTVRSVMDALFVPMLYTSLTSAAGFLSLALAPIPPVQVFGIFVSFGIMLAWILTITFIPSFIMLIPKNKLENFGAVHKAGEEDSLEHHKGLEGLMRRILLWIGQFTYRRAKLILVLTFICIIIAGWGISLIHINDNPTRWFEPSHPIRVADRVLNEHFGGTYMAYLALETETEEVSLSDYLTVLKSRMDERSSEVSDMVDSATEVFSDLSERADSLIDEAESKEQLLSSLVDYADQQRDTGPDELYFAWDEASLFLSEEEQMGEIFKQPESLAYIDKIQQELLKTGSVGKSNSLSDIVKTVYRELLSGKPEDFRVPETANGVAQCLITYQNSHRNQDLWHFVTPDHRKSVLWIQLKSGDNRDMSAVVEHMKGFFEQNPPPLQLQPRWFGLTYINVIWQDRMVSGMLQAFLGSFFIVLFMMIVLFNSAMWGMLSMIPLTVTIALIYGVIGIIGKDYDMPVAVLSSLSLGLAVDYSIHFLSRSRKMYEKHRPWSKTVEPVFEEPARAIARNVVVIGVGFLPLLAAPLRPYQTVGFFIAAILFAAGAATLLILPALIRILERFLFPRTRHRLFLCHCGTRAVLVVTLIAVVVINVRQFFAVGWNALAWFSAIVLILSGIACAFSSKLLKCREMYEESEAKEK